MPFQSHRHKVSLPDPSHPSFPISLLPPLPRQDCSSKCTQFGKVESRALSAHSRVWLLFQRKQVIRSPHIRHARHARHGRIRSVTPMSVLPAIPTPPIGMRMPLPMTMTITTSTTSIITIHPQPLRHVRPVSRRRLTRLGKRVRRHMAVPLPLALALAMAPTLIPRGESRVPVRVDRRVD